MTYRKTVQLGADFSSIAEFSIECRQNPVYRTTAVVPEAVQKKKAVIQLSKKNNE